VGLKYQAAVRHAFVKYLDATPLRVVPPQPVNETGLYRYVLLTNGPAGARGFFRLKAGLE